jgi:2-oxoglutarate ferredoxin oxidoreductase subunit beta
VLHNNEVYGLTKGQASPTLPLGLQTKSLPEPNLQGRVNALMLALSAGFTWIGRGYAFNVRQLVDLLQRAIQHPGLAFLDVAQPCPTYNNLHHKDWYRSRVYDVAEEGYDPVVPEAAGEETVFAKMGEFVQKAHEWGERVPTGVLLENRAVPTFEQRLARRSPSYEAVPPALRPIADEAGRPVVDLRRFFAEMMIHGQLEGAKSDGLSG